MELKNYSLILISAFSLNTLIACSETEVITPKNNSIQTVNNAVESPMFEAKVNVSKGKVSFWLQNQQQIPAAYTFRLRVVDNSTNEFRFIGSGVTGNLKPRQSQKFDFNAEVLTNNIVFRAEVFHGGSYLGDYPVR